MKQISLSEAAAYGQAFGASLAGKRVVVTFKNVGLSVASDAFLHSLITGVRAGMVVVVTDDILVWGSQESQDSRHFLDFYGGLWLEPRSSQEAYTMCTTAFELSEKFDIPVVLRLTNSFFSQESTWQRDVNRKRMAVLPNLLPSKFIAHPFFYKKQAANLRKKNRHIQEWADELCDLPVTQHTKGVIVCGATAYDPTTESADICHLVTLPIPHKKLRKFLNDHESIEIIEDGDAFVTEKIKALTSTHQITSVTPQHRGDAIIMTKWSRYEAFFRALKQVKAEQPTTVIADITQFTVESQDTVDAALCLGSAISVGMGHAENSSTYTFSLAGDCSFLHEGAGIIEEAIARDIQMGLVIFDNSASWCTGGQAPAADIHRACRNERVTTFTADYLKVNAAYFVTLLKEMQATPGVSILILKVPLGDLNR